jgi:hypothetical protein
MKKVSFTAKVYRQGSKRTPLMMLTVENNRKKIKSLESAITEQIGSELPLIFFRNDEYARRNYPNAIFDTSKYDDLIKHAKNVRITIEVLD